VANEPASPRKLSRGALISIGLVAATLAVYGQTATSEFDFFHVDDPDYVTDNSHVQQGISPDGLVWALTSCHYAYNWHPLTWISLQVDAELFARDPRGYHLENALLHATSAVLLFRLMRRMTGAEWRSAAVAALFALHPTRVQSVAWIAERKDVLSTLFWMLTTIAYVWYAERPAPGRYLLTLALFALGLMAKPMIVTLPATLLLFDYWPLCRWQLGPPAELRFTRASLGRLVLEKVPMFVLVAATIPLTLRAQSGMVQSLDFFPLHARLENALVAYVQYIVLFFWPVDLAVYYPHPGDTIPPWRWVGAGLLLLAVTAAALRLARSRPYVIVGWLWFLGTLVPVIGVMQVGTQAIANHYSYVPYIGLFIILVWGTADATAAWAGRTRPLAAAAALLLAACGVLSFRQVRNWRNTELLLQNALDVAGGNGEIHESLAIELARAGRLEGARDHLREAIRLGRRRARTHGMLAGVMEALGDFDGAAEQYLVVLRDIDPESLPSHLGLGRIRLTQGRYDEARKHLEAAVRLDRSSAEAHTELGQVLNRLGRPREALEEYDAALALQPDMASAHNNKGVALEALGRLPEAAASYRKAVGYDPGDYVFRCNLAYALAAGGKSDQAAAQYREATRLHPEWIEEAMAEAWQKATHPDAAVRNGVQALRLARQACQATGFRQPRALDVLAAACAEMKGFDEAVSFERQALNLMGAGGPPEALREAQERLRLYEERKQYRQP
jgi:tetratricopeptide (TPR) repeat protein